MGTAVNQDCYVLSWNDFSSNVVHSLQDIREQDDFYDVTLACDGEHMIQSHKVVLSASSPYFRGILKRSPAQNPVLLMPPGVRYKDLSSLIDFIYNGEVRVPSEDLTTFMTLAEQFKVKGLTEDKGKVVSGAKVPAPAKPQQPAKPLPKFPSGIQMVRRAPGASPVQQQQQPAPPTQPVQAKGVKRPLLADQESSAASGPPFKAFHDADGARVIDENVVVDEDEGEDDAGLGEEDIPDESADYFEDYDEPGDYGDYDYDENGAPLPGPAPLPGVGSNLQLTGLLCPTCRQMCQGVDALKDHITKMHGGGGMNQPVQMQPKISGHHQLSKPGGSKETEDSVRCNICDKVFKNHRTMVAHQKRLHQIGPERKSKSKNLGRPRKKRPDEMDEEDDDVYDPSILPLPTNSQKPVLIAPIVSRGNSVGLKKDGVPKNSDPVQRQPNLGGRPLHQSEQYLSGSLPIPGPSRRPPPPPHHQQHQQSPRIPAGVGTILPRPGHSMGAHNKSIDIKSLGHKLGGQISIISAESSPSPARRGPPPGQGGISTDGAPPTNKDGVPRIVTNRQLTQQQQQPAHLKEAETIEELELMDEEDEFEGDEDDYDEGQFGDDCDDETGDYDQDGVGHPGLDMSDSVDGMYEEGHYDEEEEDVEDGHH